MNDPTNTSEMSKFKSVQLACIIAERDTKIVEDWCLNAKEHRSSTLSNLLVGLRAKLSKQAEELDSQSRSQLEALLSKTEFCSSLTAV